MIRLYDMFEIELVYREVGLFYRSKYALVSNLAVWGGDRATEWDEHYISYTEWGMQK